MNDAKKPRFLDLIRWLVLVMLGVTSDAGALRANEIPQDFYRTAGDHIELITDLPQTPTLTQLPQLFDQAVPLWAQYFGIAPERLRSWQMRGYVVRQEGRFRNARLWPSDLPDFLHGFQLGSGLWVREQPSDYYLQHLWLHEGTHGVMNQFLGTTGPSWLAEGLAELLATHRWQADTLTLGIIPAVKEQVPYWGRIKLLREAVVGHRTLSIQEVMAIRNIRQTSDYAWVWALVLLLDQHPQWQPIFRAHLQQLRPGPAERQAAWTQELLAKLNAHAKPEEQLTLEETWRLLLDQLDYGYDVAADAVAFRPPTELDASGQLDLDTRRGWQSSGWILKKGQPYRIQAAGRYQIKAGDRPWKSEAGGITLRYERGRPLGLLLAALRSDPEQDPTSLVRSIPVGLQTELTPDEDGVLFLRINEMAGALHDNDGTLRVTVTRLSPSDRQDRSVDRAANLRNQPD